MNHSVPSVLCTAILLAGVSGCATSTGLDDVRFRILDVVQSAPADSPILFVRGQLTNSSTEPLVSGGCLRPNISIDSLAATGWVEVNTLQSEELVVCIRAFTVDPGATAEFDAFFSRPNGSWFPVRAPLRFRVRAQTDGRVQDGPTVGFELSR